MGVYGYAIDIGVASGVLRILEPPNTGINRCQGWKGVYTVVYLILTSSYACQAVTSFSSAESPLSSSTTPSLFHLPA